MAEDRLEDRRRTIPIHASLVRPVLVLGGERLLVYALGVVVAALVATSGMSPPVLLLAAVLGLAGLAGLRAAAKADPQMARAYYRHTRYQAYYPAQSRPTARRRPRPAPKVGFQRHP